MIVLLLFLAPAWAASPVGLMTVSGPVRIAGTAYQPQAVSSWPVISGDEIATEKDSRAVLVSLRSGRLEIGRNSLVTASEQEIVLHSGEVGAEKFTVRVGEYAARPKADEKGRSWFVISNRDGGPLFAAHQGDLWVSRESDDPGTEPLVVRAGTYARPAAALGAAIPRPQSLNDGLGPVSRQASDPDPSAAATSPASSATSDWSVGSLGHLSGQTVIVGIAGAVTLGTIVGVALAEPSNLPRRSKGSSKE